MENEKVETGEKLQEVELSREEAQEVGEATLRAVRQEMIERAPEEARHFAKDLKNVELQFAEQIKRAEERGEDYVSEKEFLVWEEEARGDYERMRDAETRGELDSHARAEIEVGAVPYPDPNKNSATVEAQAGNFYFKRFRELREVIEAAGDEEDLRVAKGFPDAVAEHLRFKFTLREELRDEFDTGNPTSTWQRVDEARNRAHNNSIQALNKLNNLAEKYGTTRLTFRNFRVKGYLEDLPPAEDRIAESDRACVEGYYERAFKSEVARLKAKQSRSFDYGLY